MFLVSYLVQVLKYCLLCLEFGCTEVWCFGIHVTHEKAKDKKDDREGIFLDSGARSRRIASSYVT